MTEIDPHAILPNLQKEFNKRGEAYEVGYPVYTCIYGKTSFIAGLKRTNGHWFPFHGDVKNRPAIGAMRVSLDGKVYDIFSPNDTKNSCLKWAKSLQTEEMQEFWTLPGGSSHAGESVLDAARREMLEETGFNIDVLMGLDGCTSYAKKFRDNNKVYYAMYIFVDFSKLPETHEILTIGEEGGFINEKYKADDKGFRMRLQAIYDAAEESRRTYNYVDPVVIVTDSAEPIVASDELSRVQAMPFDDVNVAFRRYSQAWLLKVVLSRRTDPTTEG